MVRPFSCGPASPNFPRCVGVKRLVDRWTDVRLGSHESELYAAAMPVVRRAVWRWQLE